MNVSEQAHSTTAKHSAEEGEDNPQLDVLCQLLLSTGFTISSDCTSVAASQSGKEISDSSL